MLQAIEVIEPGQAAAIWALLQSPRFAGRPVADLAEVQQRIEALRNDWDDERTVDVLAMT